ncbi:putative GPI-anchor transamidase [Giardia duodenalis assemblage B]|uniref:GPI-anchor transamidase n=2 Tax=Giardia intestinalis TaxID=5741 RepID=V6U178_GIAIN|nr:Hypothetical protein GSB_153933 [Giardia intestinalis]KWX13181.1 putative GPI-anchor transamidase [Giardia intestinalis assemblage B]
MLHLILFNSIVATTILLGVDTSRAPWDSRHYVNIVKVDTALANHKLIDRSILLYASDPTLTWPQLKPDTNRVDYHVMHPHELTPERLLRFLSVDLWNITSLTHVNTLILYLSGHGSPGFIRFQDSSILYKRSLERVLYALKGANRFTYLCLLVDSCHAASFIDILHDESWYVGVSSSMKNESSYSAFSDPITGIPHVDRFSLALSSINLSRFHNFTSLLLSEEFSFKHLLSHPSITGNGSLWFRNEILPEY